MEAWELLRAEGGDAKAKEMRGRNPRGGYPPGVELESLNSTQTPCLHAVGGVESGGIEFNRQEVGWRLQNEA